MKGIGVQKINDAAIRGGWKWTYEPSDYEEVAFAHYVTPLQDPKFWTAVCVTYGKPVEEAKALMVEFAEILFEKGNVNEALDEVLIRLKK